MERRNLFKSLFGTLIGAGAALAAAKTAEAQGAPKKLKVAYHLNDLDKVDFTLGNIRNHIEGVGGPQNVEIVLVVHGPALKAFHDISASEKVKASMASLRKDGLAMAACGNTMKVQAVKLDDLLTGFVAAEQGGVVRLAELQSQGYVYLRP